MIDFVVTNGDKLNPEVKINKVTDDKDEQGNAIAEFSGIKEVYYTVDGGTEKHYVLKAPATVPTSFDALLGTAAENKVLDLNDVNGKHKLTIHAIDWCGNEGKEETAELLFDHKAPKIDITPNGFVDYEDNNVTKKVTKNGTFDITITDDKDETDKSKCYFRFCEASETDGYTAVTWGQCYDTCTLKTDICNKKTDTG